MLGRALLGWVLATLVAGATAVVPGPLAAQGRRSARELGVIVGVLPPGPHNAITDVAGVLVGHATVMRGDSINTGVTAVLPHGGNLFREKVRAAVVVGNGFGKLVGFTQVQELGELESPIVLTCTLCVPRAADAVLTYLLALPGNEDVRSANAVVGETNDGFLNDIRRRPIGEAHVRDAIAGARGGSVAQGSVGAGRGTVAFGWKGGIGTASRRLPASLGGWTVGVLVQSNYGGVLTIAGAPVGRELGRYYLRERGGEGDGRGGAADGSIMIIVATDAPLSHRNLERLARRALAGLARTGSSMSNGSGDYVIAFSTWRAEEGAGHGARDAGGHGAPRAALRAPGPQRLVDTVAVVANDAMSPLFQAVIEATEEAIYNSLFLATTVRGHRGMVQALPLDSTLAVLHRYGVVRP